MIDEGKPLINVDFGGLSKPLVLLIEKFSNAITAVSRPWVTRRDAEAKADADKILAVAQVKISELEYRSMVRLFKEEAKRQENIESITRKALPNVDAENVQPDKLDNDWIANFFDKGRLISDADMQTLWAKVLAGEANSPGRFSKRTINLLASMDRQDAEMFFTLGSFVVNIDGLVNPVVFNITNDGELAESFYRDKNISFVLLTHLDDIGLINFSSHSGYTNAIIEKRQGVITYHDEGAILVNRPRDYKLDLGKVLFTRNGRDLFAVIDPPKLEGFFQFVLKRWQADTRVKFDVLTPEGPKDMGLMRVAWTHRCHE
jgi:hypothetical protein